MVRETTHPHDHRCGIRTNADRHSGAQHLEWNDPDDERDHGLQALLYGLSQTQFMIEFFI